MLRIDLLQKFYSREHWYTSKVSHREQMRVAGHDGVSTRIKGAGNDNIVVRIFLNDWQYFRYGYQVGQRCVALHKFMGGDTKRPNSVCEFVPVENIF